MRLFISALAFFVLSLTSSSIAAAEMQAGKRERDWDIPALPLSDALVTFSAHSSIQYGYLPLSSEEERLPAHAVRGRYSIDEALTRLLPEGFTFEWINERTVSILSPEPQPPSAPDRAQTSQEGTSSGSVQGSAPVSQERQDAERILERVLVRDARLWGSEMELPALIVMDRRDIEATGAATIPEVLESLAQQPYAMGPGFRIGGEQYADLRGLGADTTLILINGRRVTASAASFDANAFDLNVIPLAAVDRIEVLLDAQAVAAGADAIGGIINFILKDHASPPALEARYGLAAGGAAEQRLSLSGGYSGEVWRVSGALDYFERQALPGEERELWRDQDYRRFGSADLRSPDSNPGNITAIGPDNLPGLPQRFAAVPDHAPGEMLTAEDFLATADVRNLESAYRFRSIVPEARRLSAVGSLNLSLSERASAFAELLVTDRTSTLHDLPVTVSNVTVPAENPFNPFDTPVLASFRLSGIGDHLQQSEARFARTLAGVRYERGRWTGELNVLRVEDDARLTSLNGVDAARIAAALSERDPARALNVFDDGPGASPELLSSLRAAPAEREFASRETQVSALARGPLWTLPAGAISALLGAQWREPAIEVATLAGGEARRSILSSFAELQVPLVGPGNAVRGVEQLDLSLSARLDDTSDLGGSFNSHAVIRWRPVSDVTVRVSYGTSYRAPSLYERYLAPLSFRFALADPARNNEVAVPTVTVGGNPELREATADSWAVGVRFAPAAMPSLELSINRWQTTVEDRVAPITLPALFAHEDLFADRIVRAPASEADQAAGMAGRLLSLDVTPSNMGQIRASGIDASVAFRVERTWGRLSPSVSATWMERFATQELPVPGARERVAVASPFGTIPRWHAVGRLDWSRGVWSASGMIRFVSRYRDLNVLEDRQTARELNARGLIDVQGSVDFAQARDSRGLLSGLRLTGGINNLLDRGPEFAEVGAFFGHDMSQGDLRGRFGYLRLTKRF